MTGSVVVYKGKRGKVFRLKYRDADGRQVMETLGREADGWTEKQAKSELRERLVRVERKGWRKPTPLKFSGYAETWLEEGDRKRNWRPCTVAAYGVIVRRLVASFGPMPLASIRPRDVAAYVRRHSANYGAATLNRDLSVLHDIFACAVREELIDSNPATRAERPRLPKHKWRILDPAEVAGVERAFTEMVERSTGSERRWCEQAKVVFRTVISTGIRYSEMQELRWRDLDLVDGVLRVRRSKSEEGVRSIALGPALIEELCQHLGRSRFQGADERVFSHIETGGPYRRNKYRVEFDAALRIAGIEEYVRPFHDARHSSLTNGAANGEGEVALMARAGHASMTTTKRYLHLAGVVFREEAERLERRLFAGLSTTSSTDLSTPSGTLEDGARLNGAESDASRL